MQKHELFFFFFFDKTKISKRRCNLYSGGKRQSEAAPAAPFYFVLGARSGPANQSKARAGSLIPLEGLDQSGALTSFPNCGKF